MSPNFGHIALKVWRQLLWSYAAAGVLILLPMVPVSAQSEDCRFLVSPQDFNTFEGQGDSIVIGQIRRRPYVVLLTDDLQQHLPGIRACIPDAFLTSSRLGSYIHIASFDSYRDARDLGEHITEALDVKVRVIHLNRLRQ